MTTKTIQMYRTNLDGSETALYPLTEAKYVTMDDGTTIEEALTNSDSSKYSPVIESSKAVFKVGEGDSVDLSESAIDGAYNSCVLKGKTMVNCIQEPSSQDVVLPYEFEDGQYVTINDTKESGALGVELKGQTLVNLVTKTWAMGYTAQFNKDTITLTANTDKAWFSTTLKTVGMKAGGTYLLYTDSITYDASLSSSSNLASLVSLYEMKPNRNVGRFISNGAVKVTIPSDVDASDIGIRIHATLEEGTGGVGKTITVKGLKIIEYQQGMENWDIPYFEGMASCKMPILNSVNQLFDYSLITAPLVGAGESLSFTNDGRMIRVDFSIKRDCYQHIDLTIPSGTYNVSLEVRGNISSVSNMDTINESKLGLSFVGDSNTGWSGDAPKIAAQYVNLSQSEFTTITKSFTFDESKKITIYYHGWNDNPVGWCEFRNIRIVPQGKTSILSLPEEVVLRSLPNGVCDTFNIQTGVYIRRIKEIVLNGTEGWYLQQDYGNGAYRYKLTLKDHRHQSINIPVICDKIPVYTSSQLNDTIFGLSSQAESDLQITIPSSFAQQNGIDGTPSSLKTWLSTLAPIAVQYELIEPIVTKINLPSTLKSWNTTTHIYSEIPENTLYPILSHSNPSYPVILKPSTKYSIVTNSYSNNHTNSAINFNLGGATTSTTVGNRVTTITTPSTLTSEELVMSGRGNKLNNVMVIEGDVMGDEPYFEGICDVKSPILLNTGKNLFNIHDYSPYEFTFSGGYPKELNSVYEDRLQIVDDEIHYKTMGNNHHLNQGVGYYIPLKPNTKYTFKASRKFGDRLWALKLFLIHQDERLGGVKSPIQEPTRFGYSSENNSDPVEATFNSSKYNCLMVYIGGGWENGAKGQRSYIFNDISLVEEWQEIEPHKSNTTTFEQKDDKTIVLRSLPNGVCDTLNIETGEYVQRIGEVVKNNSTGFSLSTGGWENKTKVCTFEHFKPEGMKVQNANDKPTLNCDRVSSNTFSTQWGNSEGIESITQHSGGNIVLSIARDKLLTQDVDGLNTYLQSNPLTIQYELETPIVTTIDVQGFPYAYKDGHVQLSSGHSGQSLTPKVEYSLVANRNGQIEANTKSIRRHQDKLDDFEALMLTQMIQTHYEKTLLQFDFEMQMMALGGE